jgi:hypothetical protein
MKNVIHLRNELCQVFDELRSKEVRVQVAKELVNAAGKIINSVKLELEYAQLRKETPVIDFLGGVKTPEERAAAMKL